MPKMLHLLVVGFEHKNNICFYLLCRTVMKMGILRKVSLMLYSCQNLNFILSCSNFLICCCERVKSYSVQGHVWMKLNLGTFRPMKLLPSTICPRYCKIQKFFPHIPKTDCLVQPITENQLLNSIIIVNNT